MKQFFEHIDDKDCLPAVVYIPVNTVKLRLTATLLNEDDTFTTATRILHIDELHDALIDGDFWESENGHYVITEEGLKEISDDDV